MKLKKGKIDIVVFMLVAAIAGLLIWSIFGEPIKKAFAAVTDPLLKKVGLEEDKSEQQKVEQELLENAKGVFHNFKNVIEHCKNSLDLRCACGKMDFTQLNKYSILLSNKRDTGNTYLNLLGSDRLPVQPQVSIDNFPTLPKDIYEDAGKYNDYKNKNNDLIFSIEKVVYRKKDGSQEEKFKGKMNSIYFSKPESGFTIFDKYDNKIPMYICRSFSCCGGAPVSSRFTSPCNDICSTNGCIVGIDDGGTSKECSVSFGFEEDHPADDYCICGKDYEKVIPRPPNNFKSTCNALCTNAGKGCIIGIDDGNKNKECNIEFQFEKNQNDDYCICGSNFKKIYGIPG